jgi:tetratricopeptide (TPR) repeat protein
MVPDRDTRPLGEHDPGDDQTRVAPPEPAVPRDLPPRIGHYRPVRLLGEGGMGSVYEAEQENPRRRVAVKVVRAGLLSTPALRRFEIESQVLGRLQHPGIAQIFEAGTADTGFGPQPFFAMEMVRGRTLLRYLHEEKPSLERRLDLMARIADAVQYAHQQGVIHRDLKPGNILVDDAGNPKILDFGVARSTDSDLQVTLQTGFGEVVGTVPYMSPEQVSGNPDDLDTRSDVYSLGVVLYEMVSGKLPHDLSGKTLAEAARIITESDPKSLGGVNRALRGDVETIVGKALEKDKSRRYDSAAELAADLRRFLRHEPIQARPPSAGYQIGKFARRNRVLVGGVIAVFLVLAAGVVVSSSQARRAHREALTTAAVNTFMNDMLESASPMTLSREDTLRGREVTVLQLLHQAGKTLDSGALASQPLVEATVRRTIGSALDDLGDYGAAEPQLVRSLSLRREHLAANDPDVAESMDALAELYHDQGKVDEAEPLMKEALAARRRRLGSDDPATAVSLEHLGQLLMDQGKYDEAVPLLRESLDIRRRRLGSENRLTAEVMTSLAHVYQFQGNLGPADTLFTEALGIERRILGEDHPRVAQTLHDLAFVLQSQGRFAGAESLMTEAVAIWKKTLGPDHPYLAASLVNLGALRTQQGKLAEAEPVIREAVAIMRKSLGNDHPNVGASLYNLAKIAQARGNLAEAERLDREALGILEKALPAGHPTLAAIMSGLGSVLTDRGKPREGEPYLRESMAIYEQAAPDQWFKEQVKSLLGGALLAEGKRKEAGPLLLESGEALEKDPAVPADRKRQALERIVAYYRSSGSTEDRDRASEWTAKLEALAQSK